MRLPGARYAVPVAICARSEGEARAVLARVLPGAELVAFDPPPELVPEVAERAPSEPVARVLRYGPPPDLPENDNDAAPEVAALAAGVAWRRLRGAPCARTVQI